MSNIAPPSVRDEPLYSLAQAMGCAFGGSYAGMGFITLLVNYKLDYSPAWYTCSIAVIATGIIVLAESLRSREA